MTQGCTIGIDPGERWVGVARAMRGSSLALPVGTVDRSLNAVERDLRELLDHEQVARLVVGVPLRPDGREDEQATAFREFGESLARSLGAACESQDERFSSERALVSPETLARGTPSPGRKARSVGRRSPQRQRRERERSHATAAARILQRWLDANPGAIVSG